LNRRFFEAEKCAAALRQSALWNFVLTSSRQPQRDRASKSDRLTATVYCLGVRLWDIIKKYPSHSIHRDHLSSYFGLSADFFLQRTGTALLPMERRMA
jgi:hypothetical protein